MPLLAFVIAAIMIVVALTINGNWLMYNHINAQNTADLSARSALVKIIGDTETDGRIDRAQSLAVRLYNLNIDRDTPGFAPERVRFGNVADPDALEPVFNEVFSDREAISAVHVDTPLQLQEKQVKVLFSNLLGRQSVPIFAEAKASTRPIDIMLCLDCSRSMNRMSSTGKFPPGAVTIHEKPLPGSRYFEMMDTVTLFLDAMKDVNPNARVGLITFGGGITTARNGLAASVVSALDDHGARMEQPLTLVISEEINEINETLQSYVSDHPALGLGTDIYEGVQFSVDAFNNGNASQHVIMLSDGAQAAVSSPAPIVAAQDAAAAGVTIHTIAFGGNINVMGDIAVETGGTTVIARSEDELRDAFSKLLGRFRTQLVD